MMPPYDLPANKTQSGVKSRSTVGGGPKDFNEIRFEDKKGKEDFHQHAERELTTIVEANENRSVGGSRSTTIQKDETLVIKKGNRTETLEKGNDPLTLKKGNPTAALDEGSDTLTVTQGNITHSAPAGQYHVSAKTVLVEGSEKIELKCGGSTITIEPGSIKIRTETLEAEGTTNAKLTGGGSVTVTGGNAKLHGDAKVDVDSAGPATIKGNPVKLNC
jgi:type VI secretion system secreted protein VgrG